MVKKTKLQIKKELEEKIKKGIGAWKISKYKVLNKERIGFHNKKGHFITHIPLNEETIDLLKVHAKRVIIRGRLKGIRVPQTVQVSYYTQTQAMDLAKQVRKGMVPLNEENKARRDIDLLLDKIKLEFMNNIKYTS